MTSPRLFLTAAMLCVGQSGLAQGNGNPLQQEILAYRLTLPKSHSLITATREMTVHLMGQPDFQVRFLRILQMTPAEQRAEMEKDAKAMAILKTHNLTTAEYQVGVPTLRMALAAAQGMTASTIIASPANVAFAKQNLAVLKPRADSVETMILGKPPE
jgi:hypothetical protein